MHKVLEENGVFYLRFDPGEEVISGIRSFFIEGGFGAASFTAIGACKQVTLAYYDLDQQEYLDKLFDDDLEITGIIGNVGFRDGEVIIHAHGTFSDRDYAVVGGHVKEMIVSATCEVVMDIRKKRLEREMDPSIGLPTWGKK